MSGWRFVGPVVLATCCLVALCVFRAVSLFHQQATIAEVYAFHMLLSAALLVCVLAWDRRGERRLLGAAALLYGLCLSHIPRFCRS